ncbi:MAG TPA: hypothetical protein VKU41_22370 [Polyangiaceae bacterium]|nr:hypothetical protein [Polyangiaceae bacterium]
MRGYQQPALRLKTSDRQDAFRGLSRHRRMRLARVARTTLVKADQWARGGETAQDVAAALEGALASHLSKGGPKK